jgi:hypothetical protein
VPIADTTTNRGYQKPNIANALSDDVSRLRSALDSIDTDVSNIAAAIAETTAAPNATVPVESYSAVNTGYADLDIALVAKGQGATLAQIPDAATAAGNKRGIYATDWQKTRTAANLVASGSYATVSGGRNNAASGNDSTVAGGSTNSATSSLSAIGGGSNNAANALYSCIPGGRRGTARSIVGFFVFPACSVPIADAVGVSQGGMLILGVQTTDATTTTLRSDTSAAGTGNQLTLPNNSAYYVRGSVIANVTGGGNTKAWTLEGAIKRGANAASTAVVAAFTTTVVAADAGASTWTIAVSADTTNGCLKVDVTGQAATTIRWVCKLETTEVTF